MNDPELEALLKEVDAQLGDESSDEVVPSEAEVLPAQTEAEALALLGLDPALASPSFPFKENLAATIFLSVRRRSSEQPRLVPLRLFPVTCSPSSPYLAVCTECHDDILSDQRRFHAWSTPREEDNLLFDYNLCASCWERQRYLQHGLTPSDFYQETDPFDALVNCATVAEALKLAAGFFSTRPVLGYRPVVDGKLASTFRWLTWAELWRRLAAFHAGIFQLFPTAKKADRIGIMMSNSVDWIVADYASILAGFCIVPLAPAMDLPSVLHVCRLLEIKILFFDFSSSEKAAGVRAAHAVQHFVKSGTLKDEECAYATTFEAVLLAGEPLAATFPIDFTRDMASPCCMRPTSGSTGLPKCVVFSHKTYNVDVFSGEHDRLGVMAVVSSLAYASRDFAMRQLIFGNQVGVVTAVLAEDPSQLFRDIYDIRPRALSGVPRFWQAVQAEYERELQALTEAVLKASSASTLGEEEKRALEEKALRTTREKLGGRIGYVSVGGAPVSRSLKRWLERLCPGGAMEGYATTESSGIYSDNRVMEGVDVKLVDWEEYTSRDLPFPRGEICVKTNRMFDCYYGEPELTAAVLDSDGYFHTGDIGRLEVQPDGSKHVVLLDRKKNLFKLAQGEFISPERLEGKYQESPLVDQIWISANIEANLLYAVVYPKRIEQQNVDALKIEILKSLVQVASASKLRNHEIPRAIILASTPFTMANEQLTPTGKLCRRKIEQAYQDEIDRIVKEILDGGGRSNDPIASLGVSLPSEAPSLQRLVNQVLSRDASSPLSASDTFLDLGGDSLAAARLVSLVKEQLDVDIPIQSLFQQDGSLASLADHIQSYHLSSSASLNIDWEAEVSFHPSPSILGESAIPGILPAPSPPTTVLLTGATGFLGAFLLQALLTQTDHRVVCLIRVPSSSSPPSEAALARLQKTLTKFSIELSPEAFSRVEPVVADLSLPLFGMPEPEYVKLSQRVSAIYNSAAHVNSVLPYHVLKADNVTSVRHLIDFARHPCNPSKAFHHISTLSAVPVTFTELDEVNTDNLNFLSGYNQSKRVAELILAAAHREGLLVFIYRPGTIAGHSQTGALSPTDSFNRLLGSILLSGTAPLGQDQVRLELTPVDYVAVSIVFLSVHPPTTGLRTFHLTSDPIPFPTILSGLRQCGFVLQDVEFDSWRDRIAANPGDRMFPLLHYLRQGSIPTNQKTADDETRSALGSSGTHVSFTRDVLSHYATSILSSESL